MEKKHLSVPKRIRNIVFSQVKTYSITDGQKERKYMFISDVQEALKDNCLPIRVWNDVRRLEEILMSSWKLLSNYSETLPNLPNEVQFLDNLKDEIHYDADKELLIWKRGQQEEQMSKWTKSRLLKLSNDDHYQKAVERLFE